MEQMTIKRESLADRCEICHQADCYDPVNNVCQRCSSEVVMAAQSALNQRKNESPTEPRPARFQPEDLVIMGKIAVMGLMVSLIMFIAPIYFILGWFGLSIIGAAMIYRMTVRRRWLNCAILHTAILTGATIYASIFLNLRWYTLLEYQFWIIMGVIWLIGMGLSLLTVLLCALFFDEDELIYLSLPKTPHRYLKR